MRSPYCADEITPVGNTAFVTPRHRWQRWTEAYVRSPAAGAREDRTPDAFRPKSPNSAPRGKRQCSQTQAVWATTRSGLATCRKVSPLWPSCPPLTLPQRPRRLRARRGFFFKPSLEGGLELFELSKSQAPKGLGQCSFELGYPAVLRGNQLHDFGRKGHSTVKYDSTSAVYPILLSKPVFDAPVANRTHPGLGVTSTLQLPGRPPIGSNGVRWDRHSRFSSPRPFAGRGRVRGLGDWPHRLESPELTVSAVRLSRKRRGEVNIPDHFERRAERVQLLLDSPPVTRISRCMLSPTQTVGRVRLRSENFACELINFACETILFRQIPRKLLKSLWYEMADVAVSCHFKGLRSILFRALFFAVRLPIHPSGLV